MAASYSLVAATVILLVTYVLVSLRNLGRFPLQRPAVAMLGGALMLLFGGLTPGEAIGAINVDVILLLVGMMILASGLDVCGFFDLVSSRIAARAKSQASLLAWLMIATALLSALVLNDAVALLVAPVVVRSTRALRANPVPYLVAVAIAANIGSVATEVGNPQNAFIAIRSGIPFLTFTAYMLPATLACLAAAIGLVWVAFRRELAAPLTPAALQPTARPPRSGLALTLGITIAVSVGFFAAPSPDWLPLVALAGGSFGLFIVLAGVRASGLSAAIQDAFSSGFGGQSGGLVWLTALTALLSNLISNVPAVLLLAEVVPTGSRQLWLALAASSTLAGNATILGAACNVIVVQIAARDGVEVSMKQFVRAGLPVTAVTLVLATVVPA